MTLNYIGYYKRQLSHYRSSALPNRYPSKNTKPVSFFFVILMFKATPMKNTAFALEKIHTQHELRGIIAGWRLKGKSFAMIFGDFDGLQVTHIDMINAAAKSADFLLVAVESDAQVTENHPETGAFQKQADRGLVIANITFVDAVFFYEHKDLLTIIDSLQPDILIKPDIPDYPQQEADLALGAYGGRLMLLS